MPEELESWVWGAPKNTRSAPPRTETCFAGGVTLTPLHILAQGVGSIFAYKLWNQLLEVPTSSFSGLLPHICRHVTPGRWHELTPQISPWTLAAPTPLFGIQCPGVALCSGYLPSVLRGSDTGSDVASEPSVPPLNFPSGYMDGSGGSELSSLQMPSPPNICALVAAQTQTSAWGEHTSQISRTFTVVNGSLLSVAIIEVSGKFALSSYRKRKYWCYQLSINQGPLLQFVSSLALWFRLSFHSCAEGERSKERTYRRIYFALDKKEKNKV